MGQLGSAILGGMSEQNVDVVRATFDAFQRRDLQAFLNRMDPEVEYRSLVLEVEGAYHGHDGIRSWWESVLSVFPEWSPQVEEARELGNRVVSRVRAEGHGTGSGIALERDIWHVAEVRDGRLSWSAFFRTEEEALDAARNG
jgi:ketosteroid isomerase-like protein